MQYSELPGASLDLTMLDNGLMWYVDIWFEMFLCSNYFNKCYHLTVLLVLQAAENILSWKEIQTLKQLFSSYLSVIIIFIIIILLSMLSL